MDSISTALLRRVRLTVDDVASRRLELSLDGWPLLIVDARADALYVNDLRASRLYPHAVPLPSRPGQLIVRTGAVGDELFVLLDDVATVFVALDAMWTTHADIKVVESATGRLLFDHGVRYRQVAGWTPPSPVYADTGR